MQVLTCAFSGLPKRVRQVAYIKPDKKEQLLRDYYYLIIIIIAAAEHDRRWYQL